MALPLFFLFFKINRIEKADWLTSASSIQTFLQLNSTTGHCHPLAVRFTRRQAASTTAGTNHREILFSVLLCSLIIWDMVNRPSQLLVTLGMIYRTNTTISGLVPGLWRWWSIGWCAVSSSRADQFLSVESFYYKSGSSFFIFFYFHIGQC